MRVNLLITNDFTEFVYPLSKNMQVNLPVTPNDFTVSVYPLSMNMRVNLPITKHFIKSVYPIGWKEIALFAIFKNLNISVDQVYF